MKAKELADFLGPDMSARGLELDEIRDPWSYGDRAAWALFYRRRDCKVQACWSERDGGIDFMLAPPDADNTFGLSDRTGTWQFMLLLSRAKDNLATPAASASDTELMSWLRELFRIHFASASEAVKPTAQGSSNDSN